jgi:hypothetical protein
MESPVLRLMKKHGLPIRRDLFIHLNWMGSPPDPWTIEDELELPEELRDSSRFERPQRKRRRRR